MLTFWRAAPSDLETIMDLENRVFTGEQGIPAEMNAIPEEKTPRWFTVEENGQLAGAIAFFKEEAAWHAGRYVLEPACRGQGIGTMLLSYALEEMFRDDISEIYMDGRPATVHIMTKLGAEVIGEPYQFYLSTCTPLRLRREDYHPVMTDY